MDKIVEIKIIVFTIGNGDIWGHMKTRAAMCSLSLWASWESDSAGLSYEQQGLRATRRLFTHLTAFLNQSTILSTLLSTNFEIIAEWSGLSGGTGPRLLGQAHLK